MAAGRSKFSNKFGFIAAAAGSAVGLGNIWKFPFEVANGGGAAFVLMYLLFCFLLCFPVMVTEIAIGRKTQKNPVGAFTALGFPKWRFLGILGIIAGIFILSFYNVVAGWAFGYFVQLSLGNFDIGSQFGEYINNIGRVGAYAVVFMLATAYVVSRGISGGIEKASKILMPTLLGMIIILVFYSMTLPHAFEGIAYYLIPQFSEINFKVVYNALGQAFFSLSLGMGALITYGSYVSKKDNIISSSALITLSDAGIAFLAGLMMFPFVAYLSNGDMASVEGGPGFIFTILPGAFESIGPVVGRLVGALFFLLLAFAALTSTISLLEVPVTYAVDELKIERKYAVWFIALFIFMMGVPSLISSGDSYFFTNFITYIGNEKATSFIDFVQHVGSDTLLPLGGFLITIFTAFVWKKNNLNKEIETGYPGFKGTLIEKYIDFAISYLCPVVLGVIFLLTLLDRFFGVHMF
ncbi:MAG: sodium-dependent transporter [Cyclobacteriaceae bacterium]|nr:sodium-dependent transporter [Cyclobacteriaceae bacterium]